MASRREQILSAVFSRLGSITGAGLLRNEALPVRVPEGGLILLRDGDAQEPDVLLSPLTYLWRHAVPVEVIVQHSEAAERDRRCDDLVEAVTAALVADRRLGGLADWLEVLPPVVDLLPLEGAAAVKAATLIVTVHYATS